MLFFYQTEVFVLVLKSSEQNQQISSSLVNLDSGVTFGLDLSSNTHIQGLQEHRFLKVQINSKAPPAFVLPVGFKEVWTIESEPPADP